MKTSTFLWSAGLLLVLSTCGPSLCAASGVELVSARHPDARLNVTGAGASSGARISADGTRVAFSSTANDLVAGDNNGLRVDLFLRDLTQGQVWLLSAPIAGAGANGNSVSPTFSADGKWIAFESTASNLVAIPATGAGDIYVRDVAAGFTRLVSVNMVGTAGGNAASSNPRITPSGQYVVFESLATDLVAGDANFLGDVFIRDLNAGKTTRITVLDRQGRPVSNEGAASPDLSSNGRYVVYQGAVTNQIWFRDLTLSTNELISARPNGQFPMSNRPAYDPQVSDDGRYVAFISEATDLLATPFNLPVPRAYRFDRQTRTMRMVIGLPTGLTTSKSVTELVMSDNGSTITCVYDGQVYQWTEALAAPVLLSVGLDGNPASRPCDSLSVSGDASRVAFVSGGTNLVEGTGMDVYRVYVADTVAQRITLVAKSSDGLAPADADCFFPSLSSDGAEVVFSAADGNLIENDSNDALDVLAANVESGTTELVSVAEVQNPSSSAGGLSWAAGASVSADSQMVVFTSLAPDLTPGDHNGGFDVFVRDRVTSTNILISVNTNGVPANGSSQSPAFSPDGRFVAFISTATDLSGAETNRYDDVYLRDLTARTTRLVSVGAATAAVPGGVNAAVGPVVSEGGRYVAFVSPTRILPTDSNTQDDLYIRDVDAGATIGATLQLGGIATRGFDPLKFCGTDGLVYLQSTNVYWFDLASRSNKRLFGSSGRPVITPDCRFIAYNWSASGRTTFFLYDVAAGTPRNLITLTNSVGSASPAELVMSLTQDGRYLAFVDASDRLSAADGNQTKDVYVLDTENPGSPTLVSANRDGSATGNGSSESPAISPDGEWVAFRSSADDLVDRDTNGKPDVFVRDLRSGVTYLVSTATTGDDSGNDRSNQPVFSPNGRWVVFNSFAEDLVADDRNGTQDVFAYPLPTAVPIRVAILPLASGAYPTITWNVPPGRTTSAEYTDRLDQPWRPLPGNPEPDGEGRLKQEDTTASGVAARYYRAVQSP